MVPATAGVFVCVCVGGRHCIVGSESFLFSVLMVLATRNNFSQIFSSSYLA